MWYKLCGYFRNLKSILFLFFFSLGRNNIFFHILSNIKTTTLIYTTKYKLYYIII